MTREDIGVSLGTTIADYVIQQDTDLGICGSHTIMFLDTTTANGSEKAMRCILPSAP